MHFNQFSFALLMKMVEHGDVLIVPARIVPRTTTVRALFAYCSVSDERSGKS